MPLPPDSSSANRKSALDEDGVPEEPPPSYEASHGNSDQVVAAGPSRPFQQPPPPTLPPRPQPYAQPAPQPPGNAHAATGVYSPFPPQNPLPGQNRPSLDAYTTGSASSSVPPDQPPVWEPTTVPRPGHPLLNLGKVLNYSQGYECSKCYNTGYKESNPSKPCRKCWQKYGKEWGGATKIGLESAARRVPPGQTPGNAQRPLPLAQASGWGRMTGAPSQNMDYRQVGPSPQQYQQQQQQYYQPTSWGPMQPQYNSSVVMQAGDSRLGGRLCRSCDGDGRISMFFFSETCSLCQGIGRVY